MTYRDPCRTFNVSTTTCRLAFGRRRERTFLPSKRRGGWMHLYCLQIGLPARVNHSEGCFVVASSRVRNSVRMSPTEGGGFRGSAPEVPFVMPTSLPIAAPGPCALKIRVYHNRPVTPSPSRNNVSSKRSK